MKGTLRDFQVGLCEVVRPWYFVCRPAHDIVSGQHVEVHKSGQTVTEKLYVAKTECGFT